MLPEATEFFTPLIYALSVVAIIYTSLVALMQEDMKKLIAYSSVAHMGFVTIGIFTFTTQGIEGGMMVMLSHGLVSAALFLIVGVVYDRMHTREIARYGGLVHRMPIYAAIFMIIALANVGLPGTSGFVGEFLVLVGIFRVDTWVAFLATTGVILSVAYTLWLYRRVIYGKLGKGRVEGNSRSQPAGNCCLHAAGRSRALLWRLSGTAARCHARFRGESYPESRSGRERQQRRRPGESVIEG